MTPERRKQLADLLVAYPAGFRGEIGEFVPELLAEIEKPARVFVVDFEDQHYDIQVLGVFSTRERAEEATRTLAAWEKYSITERDVDVPMRDE